MFYATKKGRSSLPVCSVSIVLQRDCRNVALKCYMLELIMVIMEEDISGINVDCISDFNDILSTDDSVSAAGSDPALFLHKNGWTL